MQTPQEQIFLGISRDFRIFEVVKRLNPRPKVKASTLSKSNYYK